MRHKCHVRWLRFHFKRMVITGLGHNIFCITYPIKNDKGLAYLIIDFFSLKKVILFTYEKRANIHRIYKTDSLVDYPWTSRLHSLRSFTPFMSYYYATEAARVVHRHINYVIKIIIISLNSKFYKHPSHLFP